MQQQKRFPGRPPSPERIVDPLVIIEVPRSVREQLQRQKIGSKMTYGDLITVLLQKRENDGEFIKVN